MPPDDGMKRSDNSAVTGETRTAPEESPIRWCGGAMTVDVEDYFQVGAFTETISRDDWDSLPSRVEANTDRVLDLFDVADVKATFFTLGWVAERHPDLIRRIVDQGHELALIVKRAMHLYEIEDEIQQLVKSDRNAPLSGVITSSTEMLNVCRIVEKVAATDVGVLVLGESGTGKELIARALHELGDRADKPFTAINCAAIPENLLESELFGHEKGAFTGAIRQAKGRVELADGGTLFLDEVDDVPLAIQVKLLRFLQERTFERIGGRQSISVDVRIVCATNQSLSEMIAAGTFREDLYYRLSELEINIPPLRDRDGDVELLAHNFLSKFNAENGRAIRGFSGEALAAILAHKWPGNVRELENRMKRAVIMAEGNRIVPADLDLAEADEIPDVVNLVQAREEAERREIPRALFRAEGNVSQAAKLLGVSRPTLYDLMRHHGFKVD